MNKHTPHDATAIFQYEGIPAANQLVPLGLQHVVAAVVGIVTPSILVANTCGIEGADRTLLIQVSLLVTALATLLQLFPIFGRIGSRLPVIMGISFAYVPTLLAIGGQFDLPTILGAEIVGGVVAILFGIFVKQIRVLFPPPVLLSLPSACRSIPPQSSTWQAVRAPKASVRPRTGLSPF